MIGHCLGRMETRIKKFTRQCIVQVQPLLSPNLPPAHPKLMVMLRDPAAYPLPFFHPELSMFQLRQPEPTLTVNVTHYHPDVDWSTSSTKYKSKWRNIGIRDVFCYEYARDKCPIMNQRQR